MNRLTKSLAITAALLGSLLLTGHRLDAVPPSDAELRLLTWNVGTVNPMDVRLPTRFEALATKGIVGAKANVVCLQEVQNLAQVTRLRDAIAAAGGPVYSVTIADSNPDRPDGRKTAFLYRGKAIKAPVWTSSSGYQAQALVMERVTVVNIHGPAGAYKVRRSYYPELVKWIKTLPKPVVLAGDFNLGPRGGAGIAAVLPWARKKDKALYNTLTSSFAAHTSGLGATTKYWLTFDHVMITGGTIEEQKKITTERGWIMDHSPVLTRVLLPVPATRCKQVRGILGALTAGPH